MAIIWNFPIRQAIVDAAFLINCVSDTYIAALGRLSENKIRRTIDILICVIGYSVYYEPW
jgi:hypothetical protein